MANELNELQLRKFKWIVMHQRHVFLEKNGDVNTRNGFPREFEKAGGNWPRLRECIVKNIKDGAIPGQYDRMDVRKHINWVGVLIDFFGPAAMEDAA
ncbi:TPA: hypothetical protein DDW35_13765 [Candidatus Sumerlaeota bacterium]|nr:hypothetical protein [Candidatus Sumerlaeota bacterium]